MICSIPSPVTERGVLKSDDFGFSGDSVLELGASIIMAAGSVRGRSLVGVKFWFGVYARMLSLFSSL